MGYCPWGCKELDMTEQLNNNPLSGSQDDCRMALANIRWGLGASPT